MLAADGGGGSGSGSGSDSGGSGGGAGAKTKPYDLAWCVAAVEATAGDLEKAREWLEHWAPARGE